MRSKFFYQPSYSPPSYSIALVKILKEGSITRITADADNMSRTNVDNSGKVERIPISLEFNIPSLKVEETDKVEEILGFRCKVWSLINAKTNSEISKLWITTEIKNSNFDQFVELFNFANTLFFPARVSKDGF